VAPIVPYQLIGTEMCLPLCCIATSELRRGEAQLGRAQLGMGKKHRFLLLHNCGNVFTEALPINSLSKSITIYYSNDLDLHKMGVTQVLADENNCICQGAYILIPNVAKKSSNWR
jgi:hypothetical protein